MILHVAPCGLAENDGSAEAPLNNIQKAYDRLLELRKAGNFGIPAEIRVHAGDYVLDGPLHFYSDFPVIIKPFGRDKVTVSGGRQLVFRKCSVNGKTAYRAAVPENVRDLPMLYVNGHPAQPARFPKTGLIPVLDTEHEADFRTTLENCDNFRIDPAVPVHTWHDPENILIRMPHKWIDELAPLQSFDWKTGRVTTACGINFAPKKSCSGVMFLNVREALSAPGEYYFDRQAHTVTYLPRKGEKITDAAIPEIGTLVRFDSGAKWVRLEGLHFRYGGGYFPHAGPQFDLRDAGYPVQDNPAIRWKNPGNKPFMQTLQGAAHLPGVLWFDHASDCTLDQCEVSCSNWYGAAIANGCRAIAVTNSHFHDLGGGALRIGGGTQADIEQHPAEKTCAVTVTGNHFHTLGQIYYAATGILLTNACGCLLEHNHIHDLYYTGISAGWVWGFATSATHDIRIGHNHIHDLGKGVLSDMGGIYLLGIQPGTRVYGNRVHDIRSAYYGGWGIYTDEGSSHIVVENNLAYDCNCDGFHQHYGSENIVRNNVFAFNGQHAAAVSNCREDRFPWPGKPFSSLITFENNVFLTDGTAFFDIGIEKVLAPGLIRSENNVFYDISNPEQHFGDLREPKKTAISFKKWRAGFRDRTSVIADPGFVNVEKRDFRLRPDSILHQRGFDLPGKETEK